MCHEYSYHSIGLSRIGSTDAAAAAAVAGEHNEHAA